VAEQPHMQRLHRMGGSLLSLAVYVPLLPLASAFPATPDYSVLSRRITSSQAEESTVQCLRLDALLPMQRIDVQFGPPVCETLSLVRDAGYTLGVVGLDRRGRTLRRGVEARIISMSPYRASHGFFSSHSTTPMRGFTALDTTLVGGRRFEILEPASSSWPPDEPIFTARVRWLGGDARSDPPGAVATKELRLAEQLSPLVGEWVSLVRTTGRERQPGQMDGLLKDLGPMPDAEDACERAFWAAALINPLPALGVCAEIRPVVLEAADASARLKVVHSALVDSIARLRSMPPGPFEVEAHPEPH